MATRLHQLVKEAEAHHLHGLMINVFATIAQMEADLACEGTLDGFERRARNDWSRSPGHWTLPLLGHSDRWDPDDTWCRLRARATSQAR